MIERLQALGYTVDAPPNPLTGVSTDSAYLSDFLSTISGPIILVGHSYGGFVITNAATGNPNVKALVYDDAFIPATGDTPESLSHPGSCLTPSVLNFVPFPGAAQATRWRTSSRAYSPAASPTACPPERGPRSRPSSSRRPPAS